MSLREKIDIKYKESLKSKNIEEINTLRLIRSAIKDKDIENRAKKENEEIGDQEILKLLQTLIKQRRDSIESFKTASRIDLIEKEEIEINIINQFLPKQLSSEETKKIITDFIKEKNISSIKEMGLLMQYLKQNYSGSIDMSIAGKIAKEIFNN